MKKITLTTIEHRNALQIAIDFGCDEEVKDHLKKLGGVQWSETKKIHFIFPLLQQIKADSSGILLPGNGM